MVAMNSALRSLRSVTSSLLRNVACKQPRYLTSAVASSLHSPLGNGGSELRQWNPILRMFSASSTAVSKPKSDENLLRVLDSEIECAVEDDTPLEESAAKSIPFVIEDKPGEQSVILKRKFGNEDIKVEVLPLGIGLGMEDAEDDMEEEEGENNDEGELNLTVSISKGDGPLVEFSCSATIGEEDVMINVNSVAMKDPKSEIPEDSAYEGPDFHDLDDELQKSLHEYLQTRGINANMVNYMFKYMNHKDNKEYLRWLNNIKNFIQH
eukprot:TRINITY_DN23091_c0_g1_i1.p1 TRINITY_DN23091_c0_g1~~TRINITY_DN23091_c0_g1_i1.p1  ORF type:complete len:266 (-),score=47.85 TRINITY_DN23091_c0_g1_i1:254-1051(-)